MRNFFQDLGLWDAILYALAIGCTVLVVAQRFEIEKEKKRQETPTATMRSCVPTPRAESPVPERFPGPVFLIPLPPGERPAKRSPKPKAAPPSPPPPPVAAPKPLAPVLPTRPEPVAPSPQSPSVPAPQPPKPDDDDDHDDDERDRPSEKERKDFDKEVDRGKEN